VISANLLGGDHPLAQHKTNHHGPVVT